MAEVVWSPHSLRDLENIRRHIEKENPAAARRVLVGLTDALSRLETFPLSGWTIPHGRARGAREIIRRPYRIAYDVRGDIVRILRVRHGARIEPWAELHEDD